MIIKEIAFGNKLESYIENRLTDKVNVIFSDDNNKGKTIVIQGMMYSMGYDPIFPSTFNYLDQYFYSKVEINNRIFEFLRKKSSIVVRIEGETKIFNSVRDFRYYYDENILSLPRIVKDNKLRMVDFNLFYEIFFIGQDNRSPSDLISKTSFNKVDFKNMLFSLAGLSPDQDAPKSIDDMKVKLNRLNLELKNIKKTMQLRKNNPKIAEITSKSYDHEVFAMKSKNISDLNKSITDIQKSRLREDNRKVKLQNLLSELNSLNRKLEEGSVNCADCGSDKIIYSNKDFDFDVSNIQVRQNIIKSINENIEQKTKSIERYTSSLSIQQTLLNNELNSTPPNFKEIILYQDEILSEEKMDEESIRLIREIELLSGSLQDLTSSKDSKLKEKKKVLEMILVELRKNYELIEPSGGLKFDDLFAKKSLTFSGSEGQEYYFSKLLAINKILCHDFPLIVDSFRDGELSTYKEEKMLSAYVALNKQVILTATLKKEEYDAEKYTSSNMYNSLDYSGYPDSKILQSKNSLEFNQLLSSFEVLISQ